MKESPDRSPFRREHEGSANLRKCCVAPPPVYHSICVSVKNLAANVSEATTWGPLAA